VRVIVREQPLIDDSGDILQGQADSHANTIELAPEPDLRPSQRLEVLMHEAAHWWEWLYGKAPADPEERAEWMGVFAATMAREVAKLGGEQALAQPLPEHVEVAGERFHVMLGPSREPGIYEPLRCAGTIPTPENLPMRSIVVDANATVPEQRAMLQRVAKDIAAGKEGTERSFASKRPALAS
jgi:hypothetical protein